MEHATTKLVETRDIICPPKMHHQEQFQQKGSINDQKASSVREANDTYL